MSECSHKTHRPLAVRIVHRRIPQISSDEATNAEINPRQLIPNENLGSDPNKYDGNSNTLERSASISPDVPAVAESNSNLEQVGSVLNQKPETSIQSSSSALRDGYDVIRVDPGTVWETSNIDATDEDEAPVPNDFELLSDEDDDVQHRVQKHMSASLPDFYSLETIPEDLNTLPALEYYPLRPDVNPVRLLVILPHFGNPFSTVECNLFPVSLKEEHYCFAAVSNTRGNKHLKSNIIVNNCVKEVTRNLEVFLRHFRRDRHAMVVWIREICIDACDLDVHRTPIWRDQIFERACKRLDMSHFMYKLQEDGILEKEKQFTAKPKDWMNVARTAKLPTYYPIALRTFTDEQMQGTVEDISTVPHEYLPLDLVAEEIRLIVLMPSEDPDAPVIAHLAHESLCGLAAYQCISYTWGEGNATEDLILSGQSIKIRKNLSDALKCIRSPDPEHRVTVWADAVCINQDDVAERNRQVSRMHHIYNTADGVLIWLGSASSDSDLAMDFAHDLQKCNEVAFMLSESNEFELIKTEELAKKWAALYRLLLRPYFRRLWIVQELSLASVPTAFCGLKCTAWHDIHYASLMLQLHREAVEALLQGYGISISSPPATQDHSGCRSCFQPRQPAKDLTLPHKLTWLRGMRKQNLSTSFLFLCLLISRDAECTNPRDKIFALWNLAFESEKLQEKFAPDYSLPVRHVYIQFTKAYIETTKSLDIICTPGHYCYQGMEDLDLPSWVVDWRFRSPVNGFTRPDMLPISETSSLTALDRPLYRASRATQPVTGFFGENSEILVCAGFVADTITHIAPVTNDPGEWFALVRDHCPQADPTELNRQFASMIMGDATCSWESFDSSFDKLPGADIQVLPNNTLHSPIRARTLIITSRGAMGLAPYWAKAGMEVGILMGCSEPVLLERHGNHAHVRGDCFVQGWMAGELLAGLGEGRMSDEEVVRWCLEREKPVVLR